VEFGYSLNVDNEQKVGCSLMEEDPARQQHAKGCQPIDPDLVQPSSIH